MANRNKTRILQGNVFQIDLEDGRCSFGIVIERPLFAFYDFIQMIDAPIDLEKVLHAPILFRIWMMNYALSNGNWPIVGRNKNLDSEHLKEQVFFRQDVINGDLFFYYPDGAESPASLDQIKDLECAAVWDPEHVVSRLRAYFDETRHEIPEALKPKSKQKWREWQEDLRQKRLSHAAQQKSKLR